MLKKIFSLSMVALSIVSLASCGPKNEEIELRIGFWPESQEKQDVAMYTQWKEAFEKDYPQYKIVGDPYMYSPDTIGQKVISGTLENGKHVKLMRSEEASPTYFKDLLDIEETELN